MTRRPDAVLKLFASGSSRGVQKFSSLRRTARARPEAKNFSAALVARTYELRRSTGWTQAEMGAALGVPLPTYQKYERRSPLPHHLIPRFCAVVGCSYAYFLTGLAAEPPRQTPEGTVVNKHG